MAFMPCVTYSALMPAGVASPACISDVRLQVSAICVIQTGNAAAFVVMLITGPSLVHSIPSRESMGLVTNKTRVVMIVTIAAGAAAAICTPSSPPTAIGCSPAMTPRRHRPSTRILPTPTQLAMAAIDSVQVPPGDAESALSKARAQASTAFGTTSPFTRPTLVSPLSA